MRREGDIEKERGKNISHCGKEFLLPMLTQESERDVKEQWRRRIQKKKREEESCVMGEVSQQEKEKI